MKIQQTQSPITIKNISKKTLYSPCYCIIIYLNIEIDNDDKWMKERPFTLHRPIHHLFYEKMKEE